MIKRKKKILFQEKIKISWNKLNKFQEFLDRSSNSYISRKPICRNSENDVPYIGHRAVKWPIWRYTHRDILRSKHDLPVYTSYLLTSLQPPVLDKRGKSVINKRWLVTAGRSVIDLAWENDSTLSLLYDSSQFQMTGQLVTNRFNQYQEYPVGLYVVSVL